MGQQWWIGIIGAWGIAALAAVYGYGKLVGKVDAIAARLKAIERQLEPPGHAAFSGRR